MLATELVRLLLSKRADIAQDVRAKARLHIADTVGISLAAVRGSPVGERVLRAQRSGGASGICSVFGHGARLPPTLAAMVNAALAHTMDYDDIHDIARIHPTGVTLAAALAAAELAEAPGSAVVDGVILGNEMMCRLGLVLKSLGTGPGADWFLSQAFGYLGGCLAAGVVLGLSEAELVAAIGLAYMQLAGSKEPAFGIGANARAIYTGFAAQGGLQSALLAQAGMIGPKSALDGKAGMFPLYMGITPSPEQLATLLDQAGWTWTGAAVKPWPCCRSSHPYVSVALGLHGRLDPARIDRVTVAVTPAGARLCRPFEDRCRPATLADAKYSIPFLTAFALVHGRVDLLNLDDSALGDAAVLRLAQRVTFEETLTDRPGPAPARITIEPETGTAITAELADGLRLSDEAVRDKFLACLRYADPQSQPERVWDTLQRIDDMGVAALLAVLHQQPATAQKAA